MHRSNTQSGQALLLVMIAMVPICLVLGLVVDVGMAYFTKTSARAAAQSAALAAVQAAIDGISENGWTSYQCGQGPACQSSPAACATSLASNLQSACAYAEANGFAGSNILVDAGNGTPPGVAGITGANYWVRVQVTQQNPLTFGIFSGLQKLNVTASAVAAAANMMPLDCLVALDRSADDALSMAGNAVSRISGCGVGVDSNSSSALYVNGNTTLQAPWIRVVGTCSGNGCDAISPAPTTSVPPFPDPLEGVPEPQVPDDCTHAAPVTSGGTTTYSPGEYCGGISIGSNENVTFSAGTYFLIGGGLQVSGNASLSGSGVTFYNTFDSTHSFDAIKLTGTGILDLSAPTSGPLQGILFFEDRNAPSGKTNIIDGNTQTSLTGAAYFRNNQLSFYGNSGDYPGSSQKFMMVADKVSLNGNDDLVMDPRATPSGPPITPQISAALVQ